MAKLVRDKIPEIIKNDGKEPYFYVADSKEYYAALIKKLNEEVEEFTKNHNNDTNYQSIHNCLWK